MARIPTSLNGIDSRKVEGCEKPECPGSTPLHRHHRRHEAMWFGIWASRRRHEDKFKALQDRYYLFAPEDTVVLCARHHAEIHARYDRIIEQDRRTLGKSLAAYSWPQAERLMRLLEEECNKWIKRKTRGIDPDRYAQRKRRRRVAQ